MTKTFLFLGIRSAVETTPARVKLEDVHDKKQYYQRSARGESRVLTKQNARSILQCWAVCPFRWNKNTFICAYCDETFRDCLLLRQHVDVCSELYTIKDIYKKFKEMGLINIDVTKAYCRLCSVLFTDVKHMQMHVIDHGFPFNTNQPDGVLPFSLNKESWKCIMCDEVFNNFVKLYEHMNVHYQHYICSACGKGYMTAPRLRKHADIHNTGTFPCTECGRMFKKRTVRDNHKATVHGKAPRYECPHCKIRFNSYYDRMTHLNEKHGEKEVSYSCQHCELSFKTSGQRAEHIRWSHFPRRREYKCAHCEWQFKTQHDLKRHMVKHTGKKNFHCAMCGQAFSSYRALRTHLKRHEELKCRWCGVAFKLHRELSKHLSSQHPEIGDLTSLDVKVINDKI